MTAADFSNLALSERIELVQDLWDSLADDLPSTSSPQLRQEWDERFAGHLHDPTSSIPWKVVREKLLGAAH